MTISLIIPNYNGRFILEKNLPHVLEEANNKKNNIVETIIVDDGSTDDSVNFIQKNFSEVKLIKHTKNRGFSTSVNTGVRASSGELLLLLNTDVLPKPNFLKYAVKHFENPKVFAVSLHEKNYGWARGYFADGFIQLGQGKESKTIHPSFYVSGGSGIFRKSVWKELGGLDEQLLSPFYWEDIDICYRAAKRGYINIWEPKGVVIHKHESTMILFPKKYIQRIQERNQLLFLWKNLHSKPLMRKHLRALWRRVLAHPGYLRIVLMALSRLRVVRSHRKKEIKESKVSDEAIFAMFK